MRAFVLAPNEDWVCDRFVEEWRTYVGLEGNPWHADVIWCLAGWCWNHLPPSLLSSKPVVVTVHHIDPEKFDERAHCEFQRRDQHVDLYHVPCERTALQVGMLTDKPVLVQPFWVNDSLWRPLDRRLTRVELGLPDDRFLVGSFQRDTEGSDLATPKLAKGPDVFCDFVEELQRRRGDVHVVLGGWRRQYVTRRLDAAGVPHTCFELPPFDFVNKLYNALDLYVVGSRHEGGPQAVFECAATRTPIVSTRVGAAELVLGVGDHLFDMGRYDRVLEHVSAAIDNVDMAYANVSRYFSPLGFEPFVRELGRLVSS